MKYVRVSLTRKFYYFLPVKTLIHLQVEQDGARASHGLKLFETIAQKPVYDLFADIL